MGRTTDYRIVNRTVYMEGFYGTNYLCGMSFFDDMYWKNPFVEKDNRILNYFLDRE